VVLSVKQLLSFSLLLPPRAAFGVLQLRLGWVHEALLPLHIAIYPASHIGKAVQVKRQEARTAVPLRPPWTWQSKVSKYLDMSRKHLTAKVLNS
jgi:hypothetical protein